MIPKEYKRKVQSQRSHWLYRKSASEEIIEIIKNKFQKICGLKLLDIGCAQGREVHELSEYGILAEGIDVNKEFIKEARKLYPSLKFSVGDIENLIPKSHFDVVLCINTLFYTKIEKSLPKIEKLLKTGEIGIITLDEKIVDLNKNKIIHQLDVEKALSILKKSRVIKKEFRERIDLEPFRHKHIYYLVVFEKVG